MTVITNNTNAADYGSKAAQAWANAQKNGDAGDANAIAALYLAARTMTFSCIVERKKEDISETIDFDLQAWALPLFNTDGSKDTRAMSARTHAVALRLFGISELNNAIKQRLDRAKKAALYLAARHATMDDEAYEVAVSIKANKLVVPYGAVHPIPEDSEDNEATIYEAMKDKLVSLDGNKGNSLAELGKRASPKSDKRASTAPADKGNSLIESIKFVSAVVAQWNDLDGETEIAPNKDMRIQLYNLQISLAAMFTADPIGDDVKVEKAA